MFAAQFDRFGAPDVLFVGASPEPHAGPGQVRIRVRAAGVAPVDLGIRAGSSPSSKNLVLPHIPGVDAAGVVDEVGAGVTDAVVGDDVFGMVDLSRLGGATAEYAVLAFWAQKPASWSWDEAGASASSIETATRALDLLGVGEGETLLIDGAAGGVGSVAVQLAIARGARVIGTASAGNQDFVRGLGAISTTYGAGLSERVAAAFDGTVDYALHVSGADALEQLIAITGSPDSVVTIADYAGTALGVRVSIGEMGGQPNGRHGLAIAAALVEDGRFRIPVQRAFPLADAAAAHALATQGARQGKVVVTLP
jgi:NADPH:quinone reductase-like Zn-dependent oxidoreductase